MKLSKLRARTATRHLAGATIPRQDTTSFGMRNALKKAAGSGYAGEAEVEGKAARPRLDRPGRKAGGRVGKADGGETYKRERAPGEKDEGAQRDYLKNKAQNVQNDADSSKWIGRAATGVGAAGALGGKGLGRLPGAVTVGLGIPLLGRANKKEDEAKRLNAEAKEFDKADIAEKKFGGRAKAKSKDRDGDDD